MTLTSDLFQEVTKGYVKLQIDIDIGTDPQRIGPLDIQYTPVFILLNSNFKEIDRLTQVQSPLAFKHWLDKASSYKEPIRELAQKKTLSSEEKERLSLWYLIQWKISEAKKFIEEKSTSWVKQSIDMRTEPTFKKIDLYLEKLKSRGSLCGDREMIAPINVIYKFLRKSKDSPTQLFSLVNKYESIILAQKKKDPLACAYLLDYLYGWGQHMVKGTALDHKKDALKKKTLQNALNFPTLPGVTKKTQLEYQISRLKEDKKETKKLLDKMRSENKNDYTYDYWEASLAYYKENYEEALEKVNKSLEIAKDRGWQKALSLKIDILTQMEKHKEAQKIIEDTLKNIDLPYSKFPIIHSFVQKLRKKQVALLEKKAKSKTKE